MKYGKIKKALQEKGFVLEYIQTSGNLDLLQYQHPNINGLINVDFSLKNKIPKNVVNGAEFTYDDPWVENMNVCSVSFDIDISISFLSDGIIDTYGCSEENQISLFNKDLKLFDYVLDIVTNPYSIIDFQVDYNKKLGEFLTGIKRFIPAMEKYNMSCSFYKTGGNETTMYSRVNCFFQYGKSSDHGVYFYFDPISWKTLININVEPGFMPDTGRLEFDCKLEDFEKELDRQKLEYESFMILYKEEDIKRRAGLPNKLNGILDFNNDEK